MNSYALFRRCARWVPVCALAAAMSLSVPARAATVSFFDPNVPFLDVINITQLGGSGDFDLTIDLTFRVDDRLETFSLDAGGEDNITFYGFLVSFTLVENGAGWSSNVDLAGDPAWGFKTYEVLGANQAVGTCSRFAACTWDIAITSVPLPGAAWLMGSALLGMAGLARSRRRA